MKTSMSRMLSLLTLSLVAASSAFAQSADVDNVRSYSKKGINVFETPKKENAAFEGMKVSWGGGFNQTFQLLKHSNTAKPLGFAHASAISATNSNRNELVPIGNEFNNEQANLMLDVQLDEGVRMHLTTYLSARHHQESWVKGGYIQFDAIPFIPLDFVSNIMKYTTIKIGHMENNFGDAHFRRNDGGHTLYNPFVENYIMDAFTTEIGAEIYGQYNGFLGMVSMTNGEIKGDVSYPDAKAPAYIVKLGYDKQMNEQLRVRLTGSLYTTKKSAGNTLYGGDRTGSHYFYVMEPTFTAQGTKVSPVSNFTSGRYNPGMRDKITAFVINPFVKFGGLEFFGNYEVAKGRGATETSERTVSQLAGDVVYRLGAKEEFYVGARYNTVNAESIGLRTVTLDAATPPNVTAVNNNAAGDIKINRVAFAGGWFINDYAMVKAEYVVQKYVDFPEYDLRNGGKFNGFIIEATIGF